MPPLEPMIEHLFLYNHEIGEVDWLSIKAWATMSGNWVSSWECSMMIKIHRSYINASRKYDDKNTDAPFAISIDDRRSQVYNAFKKLKENLVA